MDHEHGPPFRGSIPRLSRLPKPRASQDNLKLARSIGGPSIHQDEVVKSSNLPRLSKFSTSRIGTSNPLGESINRRSKSQYGLNEQFNYHRDRSPVRDALQASQPAFLDTTPPRLENSIPTLKSGNENGAQLNPVNIDNNEKTRAKRRPRPSLSERTAETLAQISPSPSPTRRRQSTAGHDHVMRPPLRPTSSMQQSRPETPSTTKADTLGRRHFRPPGRSSPTKELTNLVPVPSPSSIHTPPRVFVRDRTTRISRPPSAFRPTDPTDTRESLPGQVPSGSIKRATQTLRAKGSVQNFSIPLKQSRPTTNNLFEKPGPSLISSSGKLAVSNLDHAPIPSKEKPAKLSTKRIVSRSPKPALTVDDIRKRDSPSAKTSAALRQTIAAAKAARKAASKDASNDAPSVPVTSFDGNIAINDDAFAVANNKSLLQTRIDMAVSTGHLNIAAMQLNTIPDEVIRMYEPGQSSVNWAEMVDLTKLNAADNQIAQLVESVFPDSSAADLIDDEERYNQFGGLETLDLHNNLLSMLPIGLRRLERLSILNLNGNKLTNEALDVIWQIPNLRELHLANNALQGCLSFEKAQFSGLRVLNVCNNQITELDAQPSQLSTLHVLDLSHNKLRQLPAQFSSASELVRLNMASNMLTGAININSMACDKLLHLDISHNAIDSLVGNELDCPALQTLTANNNRFRSLPDLSKLQSLISLYVSENDLSELPQNLAALQSLRNLDIGQNSIRIIDYSIVQLESLITLNLTGNPLRDKKYLTMDISDIKLDLEKRFAPEAKRESDVKHPSDVASFILGDNTIDENDSIHLFKPAKGVLDLSSQNLSTIDINTIDLTSSQVIHTLSLSNNDLTSFPHELLSHPAISRTLTTLNLSHNFNLHPTDYLISKLSLPALRSLFVVSTGLTSLSALTANLDAPSLTELNISCHRLTGAIPNLRSTFPNLRTLLATDNWFSSIDDISSIQGLEVLDIRNNEIESLPPTLGLLGNFPSNGSRTETGRLRVFECSGNRFRVPRMVVVERGTEAVLRDLRRMINVQDVPEEWAAEI